MSTFHLANNGAAYELDLLGGVSLANATWGKWACDSQNQIVLTKTADNTTASVPVTWTFKDNQLLVLQNGVLAGNLSQLSNGKINFTVSDGYLKVEPIEDKFSFTLFGQWKFSTDFDLQYTPTGSTTSTLAGAVNDYQSLFIYKFDDEDLGVSFELDFAGKWSFTKNTDGKLEAHFVFDIVTNGTKTTQTFDLPVEATVQPGTNLLILNYTPKDWSITLVGKMKFGTNKLVSYEIDASNPTGYSPVIAVSIAIDAPISGNHLNGSSLHFAIQTSSGVNGKTVLTVTGKIKVTPSSGTLSFGLSQSVGGPATGPTVTLAGTFSSTDGKTTASFDIKVDGKIVSLTLAVNTDLHFGNGKNTAHLFYNATITTGPGGIQGISMLFGVNVA